LAARLTSLDLGATRCACVTSALDGSASQSVLYTELLLLRLCCAW
jgi:hypothetical protein